jgi:dipeptidyl aminopeptidase/acylaminoacyl peptidase
MKKTFLIAALVGTSVLSSPAFARPMSETDLATMKRLSGATASPDGTMIAYQLRETDLEANKGKTDLFMLKLGVTNAQPVRFASKPDKNEHDPAFSPDGKSIFYISNESGSEQIWRYDIASGTAMQASNFKTDVAGFKISPDGEKFAVWGRHCARLHGIRLREGRRHVEARPRDWPRI